MSIINDALKKVQQGLRSKADAPPAGEPPSTLTGDYIFVDPKRHDKQADEMPVKKSSPIKNWAKSIMIMIFAAAFLVGALVFLNHQLNVYFPHLASTVKSSFLKLIHKEELPAFKTKSAQDLVPLAKITVNSSKPAALTAPANTPSGLAPAPDAPLTLNIHGVMSNGGSNVVLIDDQVYQQGDNVDGVKILKINLDSIQVLNNGKEETIRVKN